MGNDVLSGCGCYATRLGIMRHCRRFSLLGVLLCKCSSSSQLRLAVLMCLSTKTEVLFLLLIKQAMDVESSLGQERKWCGQNCVQGQDVF